jgi:chitinase
VVTVFIEDYTSVQQLSAALGAVNGLNELLLRPDRTGVRQHGWPRRSELIASNQRLLIFSQSPGREAAGVMHDRDWTVENYWSLDGGGNINCYTRWAEVPLSRREPGFRRLHVMNHYRNIPAEPAAVVDNGAKLRNRVERICGPAARTKPNYVAVDFYQKPDGGATNGLVAELNTYW